MFAHAARRRKYETKAMQITREDCVNSLLNEKKSQLEIVFKDINDQCTIKILPPTQKRKAL